MGSSVLGWLIVAGIVAVTTWTVRNVVRSIKRVPARRALIRVVEAGTEAIAVNGVISSTATVRGLVTGAPCAVATTSVTAADPRQPGWPSPLWQRTSAGDLQVRYDEEIVTRPRRVNRQPGTLAVRADQIAVAVPVGRETRLPIDAATVDRLAAAGLPAEIGARMAAAPHNYVLTEHVLLPGDVVHLAPGPRPDPDREPRFLLSPGAQEFVAAGAGIFTAMLVPVVLFGLVCAGVIAFQLIVG